MVCENAAKMIMSVCVGCVYIVTIKCRAVRQNLLNEHGDQETISFLYTLFHHGRQQQQRTTEKPNERQ